MIWILPVVSSLRQIFLELLQSNLRTRNFRPIRKLLIAERKHYRSNVFVCWLTSRHGRPRATLGFSQSRLTALRRIGVVTTWGRPEKFKVSLLRTKRVRIKEVKICWLIHVCVFCAWNNLMTYLTNSTERTTNLCFVRARTSSSNLLRASSSVFGTDKGTLQVSPAKGWVAPVTLFLSTELDLDPNAVQTHFCNYYRKQKKNNVITLFVSVWNWWRCTASSIATATLFHRYIVMSGHQPGLDAAVDCRWNVWYYRHSAVS